MTVGLLIPKAILFIAISYNRLVPGASLAVIWCLGVYIAGVVSRNKVNAFMVLALVMIVLRVVVILASENPSLYLIAQALDSAVYSVIFFLSLFFKRSVIQVLAESSGIYIPENVRASHYYSRCLRIVTSVWASAYLLVAVILAILRMENMRSVAAVDILSSWPLMMALILFTVIFPRWYWKKNIGGNIA